MRTPDRILCSCGGEVKEVETTADEAKEYGCGVRGCCTKAFQCASCGIRWLFALEAPEMDYR